MNRGRGVLAVALVAGVAATTAVALRGAEAAVAASVSVDFTAPLRTAGRVGVTITGYGNQSYITNNATHRGHVEALAPALMRIELAYETPGDPTSRVVCGGSFCDTAIDGSTWLTAIRDLGGEPVVILPLDGRHAASVDVADAVNLYTYIVDTTGTPVTRFIIGNETDNGGNPKKVDAATYSARFNLIAAALDALDPGLILAGPGTAHYNTDYLDTFLAGSGSTVDVVDFHKYAQGGDEDKSEFQLLGETDGYRTTVSDLRQRIDAAVPDRAGQIGIQIGEYNLDWNDDPKQLTGFTTVWSAAALGNLLAAGATAIQYGDKNGALGLTSQDNVGGVPSEEPLPIYHGIGMFTGAGNFRPLGAQMVITSSSDWQVKAFAAADSHSLVLVNIADTDRDTTLTLTGVEVTGAQVWQCTQENPAPAQVDGATVTPSTVTLTLPARSVSTVLLDTA